VERVRNVYLEQQMGRLPEAQRTPEERQRRHDQIWAIPLGGVGGVRRGIATGLSTNSPTPAERADTLDTRNDQRNAAIDARGEQHVADELQNEGIPEMTTRLDLADRDFSSADDADIREAVLVMNHPTLLAAADPQVQQIARISALRTSPSRSVGYRSADPEMRRMNRFRHADLLDAASTAARFRHAARDEAQAKPSRRSAAPLGRRAECRTFRSARRTRRAWRRGGHPVVAPAGTPGGGRRPMTPEGVRKRAGSGLHRSAAARRSGPRRSATGRRRPAQLPPRSRRFRHRT
jgi:hypothetical protein